MTTQSDFLTVRTNLERILVVNAGVEPDAFEGHYGDPLESLGIDSLALLELQVVASEQHQVDIPDDGLTWSLDEIVNFVLSADGLPKAA